MRYKLLGKSGLRVSELCLGTMTFGDDWGWGSGKDESRQPHRTGLSPRFFCQRVGAEFLLRRYAGPDRQSSLSLKTKRFPGMNQTKM